MDKNQNNNEIWLKRAKPSFPEAFLYNKNELILEKKNNCYISVADVESNLDFDCKLLEWVSRSAYKHPVLYWRKWFLRGLTSHFKQDWTSSDMEIIYCKLGNGVNRNLCEEFITGNFDLDILRNHRR